MMVDLTQEEQAGGYLFPENAPPEYRWAADKLVAEFGRDRIRIGFPEGVNDRQMVALYWQADEQHPREHGLAIPLYQNKRPYRNWRDFDLNVEPERLEQFIQSGRKAATAWAAQAQQTEETPP